MDSHQLPTGFFDDEVSCQPCVTYLPFRPLRSRSSATLGAHYQQQQDILPVITLAENAQESSREASAYSLEDLTDRIQARSNYPIASGGFGDIWKCILVNPNEVVQVCSPCGAS